MATIRKPIPGQPFNDVLNELHAHAITGVPDESDPFILDELEREYIAYAIGIGRDDQVLMGLAFGSISANNADNDELLGIVRDIDRLVVVMKAATSKNRTDPIIRAQLHTRGILI